MMKTIVAICIAAAASAITLYCGAGEKPERSSDSIIISEFDWSKLRTEPLKWVDREVALEGWVQVYVDAVGKVCEVWLRETPEGLEYALKRRSVEVSRTGFLEAVSRKGIDADAMAIMLSGKPLRISGKLIGVDENPLYLGELTGEIKFEAIDVQRPGILSEIDHKK